MEKDGGLTKRRAKRRTARRRQANLPYMHIALLVHVLILSQSSCCVQCLFVRSLRKRISPLASVVSRTQLLAAPYNPAFIDFGVDFNPPRPIPAFPHTCYEVADAAFAAISATLYDKQSLDPNSASNAMRRSVLDYRPIHDASGKDKGRLGVEIDGARHLLGPDTPPLPLPRDHAGNSVRASLHDVEGRGIRRVALILASKLAREDWLEQQAQGEQKEEGADEGADEGATTHRSVLVYFNTMQQTLLASRELTLLKQEEAVREHGSSRHNDTTKGCGSSYDNVRLLCLGEGIPKDMRIRSKDNSSRKKHQSALATGSVDPGRGVVVCVQPTDINSEARPPATASGKILSLQETLAQASVACLPAVILSPRLTEQYAAYEMESGRASSATGSGGGFDQSGYLQSATFGGAEPPRITPWVTRDFTPPVFAWVGCGLEISRRQNESPASILHTIQEQGEEPKRFPELSYFSRIGMMHSVIAAGRPWYLFAALETLQGEPSYISTFSLEKHSTTYQYVASTKTSSGRPPISVLERVYNNWCSE